MASTQEESSATGSAQLPTTCKCVVQGPHGGVAIEDNQPIPALADDMILVRTACVALNPNDYKMVDNFPTPGLRIGCDFSGTVVALGAKAHDSHIQTGDRVCGAVHGSNPLRPHVGAFGEYVTAYADCVLKLSPSMDWSEGAAIGGAVPATLGIALRETLHLPGDIDQPASEPFSVLVWGGATANGTMAVQLLKRAGAHVIATCSPGNFDFVRSYGADAVFDYRAADCAASIKAYSRNRLRFVLDTIGTTASMSRCYAAIGRTGGRYTSLEKFDPEAAAQMRRAVHAEFVLGLSMSGEAIDIPGGYRSDARPDRRRLGRAWFASLQRLLDEGQLRSHPPRDLQGALEAVPEGLDRLRKGVSGIKLVSSLA